MKLSIVIPAYNEERRLKPMLDTYTAFFIPKYGNDVEFIVVVNGSTDRTEQIVRDYAQNCPRVCPIIEPQPIGKGGAIMLGFNHAQGDWVGFVDADNATPAEAFQDLVDRIGDAGAIIASRWLKGSVISTRQPLKRRIASRVFNTVVRLMFGLPISDTQCGAKVIRRDAMETVLPLLGVTRWAFDVDLLFQLHRAGYRIIEWPTTWRDASGSKLNVARASSEMIVALVRLRLLYSPFRWVVTAYDSTIGRLIHLE